MKFASVTVALCLAAAAPLRAAPSAADAPAPDQTDPATLGKLDGVLSLCAKVDPANQASYDRHRAEMIVFAEGTPYEMRVPGSDSPAYKQAYEAVREAAGRANAEEQTAQCRRAIGVDAADKSQ
jgi:hypothetical protein